MRLGPIANVVYDENGFVLHWFQPVLDDDGEIIGWTRGRSVEALRREQEQRAEAGRAALERLERCRKAELP